MVDSDGGEQPRGVDPARPAPAAIVPSDGGSPVGEPVLEPSTVASNFIPPKVEYVTPSGEPDVDEPIDPATNVILEESYSEEHHEKVAELLLSRNPKVRKRAAEELRLATPATGEKLAKLLTDPNQKVRLAAARKFAALPELAGNHIAELTAAAFDEDDDVAKRALSALGETGVAAKPAIPALVFLLEQPEGERTVAAVRAVGNIGPDAKQATAA